MGQPRFELLIGAINGANLVFTTSVPYTAGTLAVYLNGQLLLNSGGNPWTETTPGTGVVTMHAEETPRVGDELAAFYLDTTTAPDQVVIEEITAILLDLDALEGVVADQGDLIGVVADDGVLVGMIDGVAELEGMVRDQDQLIGIMEEC